MVLLDLERQEVVWGLEEGLGNMSILYRYRDMRLDDIVLDFGHCNVVSVFLVLKAALQ